MAKNTVFVNRYRDVVDEFLKAFEALTAISNEFAIRQPTIHDDDIAEIDITAEEFMRGAESVASVLQAYAGKAEAHNIYQLRR